MNFVSEAFFERLFGFREAAYTETRTKLLSSCRFEARDGRERAVFTNPVSGLSFSSGWHYVPQVKELRREVQQNLLSFEEKHPGYLERVTVHLRQRSGVKEAGSWWGPAKLRHVTGESGGQHLVYPGALFQAASQLNLLEFISPEVTPEDGVQCYAHDRTQGPACALACMGGTAYRNYLIHPTIARDGFFPAEYLHGVLKELACVKPQPPCMAEITALRGQTAQNQINTLHHLTSYLTSSRPRSPAFPDGVPKVPYDAYYTVRNGYFFPATSTTAAAATSSEENTLAHRLQALAAYDGVEVNEFVNRLSDHLSVGIVEEATVTSPFYATKNPSLVQAHTVSQTLCSALSLDSFHGSGDQSGVSLLAKCVLNGTYEATLLAGVLHTLRYLDHVIATEGGSVPDTVPPVFLTKVGGGVFNNDPAWIKAAIRRGMETVSKLGVPLDVRLVHFLTVERAYMDL